VRAVCGALVAAFLLTCCARDVPAGSAPYMDVPHSTITAIELRKTNCFGTCPAFAVRFTADGRATYDGGRYAPRVGRFAGRADFERLAAWIDSQHPETLADGYATNWIDTPTTTLVIERGSQRKIVRTSMESQAPLRFEGMIFALEGLISRMRWKPIDDLTPYVGVFANGTTRLYVDGDVRQLTAYTPPSSCGDGHTPLETVRVRGGLRLRCSNRVSTLRAVPEGLRAEGDAIPAGLYQRITQREADRRAGLVPEPQRT
jgi:Domain of unknown function (DUF6438)